MSFHWCDNIHTRVFTPRDYQVEILAAAFEENVIVCLGQKSSKEFIALNLLQELAKEARAKNRFFVYLTRSEKKLMTMIEHFTDLKTFQESPDEVFLESLPSGYEVFAITPQSFFTLLRNEALILDKVQLLILEDCHEADMYKELVPIFEEFYRTTNSVNEMPKVLGLAGPIHSVESNLRDLSAMLCCLEESICCRAETASDIVTVLRYCSKPIEYILQCAPFNCDELTVVLDDIISSRRVFLNDHRYDPTEIYNSDDLLEDLKDIPDPRKEPLDFLNTVQEVLYEMGPWSANRMAVTLFHSIEKQKIKTPHERHYILFCLVNTALFEIHSICEHAFSNNKNRKELIEKYSSPKVLRLLELLRLFKPQDFTSDNIKKINKDLENADFQQLRRTLENSCQNVESCAKKPSDSETIIENLKPIVQNATIIINGASTSSTKHHKSIRAKASSKSEYNRRPNHLGQRRAYARQQNRETRDGTEALCALIFCNYNHTAKVLFDLIADVSRNDVDLKFLKCQYITDRVADPLTEPKEAELEHRRQEDVLKRFRMHDCNLLIGTDILEEGIDLPKCNLVIRWDPPKTYRSYVQGKGRSRAATAYHVILAAPRFNIETHNSHYSKEYLADRSHKYFCEVENGSEESTLAGSNSSNEDGELCDSARSEYIISSSKGIVKILNPNIITNVLPTCGETAIKQTQEKESLSTSISNSAKYDDDCYKIVNLSDLISESKGKFCEVSQSLDLCKIAPHSDIEPSEPSRQDTSRSKNKCRLISSNKLQNHEMCSDGMESMINTTNDIVNQLAQYQEIEKMLLRKCANSEPSENDHKYADEFAPCIAPYKPLGDTFTGASVDLNSAVLLVNKYCSKLPSDTFTKLTPIWRCAETVRNGVQMFQCTLRLPINSPLKYDIVGLPMHTEILARRMVALQACKELHIFGELDDNLQPIGKESFKAIEQDWETFELEEQDEDIVQQSLEPRPGTTKRRQYYYKRIASEFCNCRPTQGVPCYLYFLDLTLQCPIPEEQNTRGRKIYPPEHAQQGFGILTLKKIPKISSFSIFTRSGEVKVSLHIYSEMVLLTERQIRCINTFINYTFTNVLRLQKFLMLFDPDSTENCVFIVPTTKAPSSEGERGIRVIDWEFLDLIERNAGTMPTAVSEEERRGQSFCAKKFKDAVVMPWYRNQDQPQYFYVAEICPQLTPLSCFPGENYRTFKHYYFIKYGLIIQNVTQPLLDVDHTSARLNFLTPRYVNRKGVALPTSSEETKRAKRENLEQKQILVPELCTVHPFPASLWRTAVCLPCILYRINGLLLADDIRRKVASEIGLGQKEVDKDFEWPMLDFGWSLSEVLRKSKKSMENSAGCSTKSVFRNEKIGAKSKKGEHKKMENHTLSNPEYNKAALEIVMEGRSSEDTCLIEIGTWSNDMADSIQPNGTSEDYEFKKDLSSNMNLCDTPFDQSIRYGSPTFWNLKRANLLDNNMPAEEFRSADKVGNSENQMISFSYNDSDDSYASSYDSEFCGESCSSEEDNADSDESGLPITFTSKNEAEFIEPEEKRNKELSINKNATENELDCAKTKNLEVGFNFINLLCENYKLISSQVEDFTLSLERFKNYVQNSGKLIEYNKAIQLPKQERIIKNRLSKGTILNTFKEILPYVPPADLEQLLELRSNGLNIDDIELLNLKYVNLHPDEEFAIVGSGDLFDNFNDKPSLRIRREKHYSNKFIKLNFEKNIKVNPSPQLETAQKRSWDTFATSFKDCKHDFSFDYQPELLGHPGPSPSIILQALTMSNANDGINLERLETIGDSFLKYAITTYLYITYEDVHEGKLSHLRSKQVSNLNLYRLGRKKVLGEYMIATKFEPHDNWLPPCYYVPKELEKALIEAKIPPHHWKLVDLPNIKKLTSIEICELVREKAASLGLFPDDPICPDSAMMQDETSDFTCFIPYNLVTQHSIPDKSVADSVEALIGAYLIECGPRGALLFMAWLGIRVLPIVRKLLEPQVPRQPGSTNPELDNMITVYGEWSQPKSPLLHYSPNAEQELEMQLDGFDEFESKLGYKFHDRSYLLQAMTHASYSPNRVTDCYQRLEFLGDAVLDYLITRHLYEDSRQHSPGALTDLRSALVNNTIFASLAVRHGFHKYFRHLSPGLNEVIDRFVRIQSENGHSISEEYYLLSEEECDDAVDVEVPKALGDVFESVAGAIFLDSNLSLNVVWKVYSNMMSPEIELFSDSVPKSPIRELLELEPETAKFGKPEKLADGRRVRVTVEVFCKGIFKGIGRNYRIAKCTAAKCALRHLKKQGSTGKKKAI